VTRTLRRVASGVVGLALAAPLVGGALGWTVNTVESGSMDVASGYGIGDLVVTAPLHGHAPVVGEVVRVRGPVSSDNAVVQKALELTGRADPGFVHRVVELRAGGVVLTQGDANDAADAPHELSDLAGRVVAHGPQVAGTAWTTFRSIPAQAALAIAAVLLWPARSRRRRARPARPAELHAADSIEQEPVGRVRGRHRAATPA